MAFTLTHFSRSLGCSIGFIMFISIVVFTCTHQHLFQQHHYYYSISDSDNTDTDTNTAIFVDDVWDTCTNGILIHAAVNASNHVFPWLATYVTLAFLGGCLYAFYFVNLKYSNVWCMYGSFLKYIFIFVIFCCFWCFCCCGSLIYFFSLMYRSRQCLVFHRILLKHACPTTV